MVLSSRDKLKVGIGFLISIGFTYLAYSDFRFFNIILVIVSWISLYIYYKNQSYTSPSHRTKQSRNKRYESSAIERGSDLFIYYPRYLSHKYQGLRGLTDVKNDEIETFDESNAPSTVPLTIHNLTVNLHDGRKMVSVKQTNESPVLIVEFNPDELRNAEETIAEVREKMNSSNAVKLLVLLREEFPGQTIREIVEFEKILVSENLDFEIHSVPHHLSPQNAVHFANCMDRWNCSFLRQSILTS